MFVKESIKDVFQPKKINDEFISNILSLIDNSDVVDVGIVKNSVFFRYDSTASQKIIASIRKKLNIDEDDLSFFIDSPSYDYPLQKLLKSVFKDYLYNTSRDDGKGEYSWANDVKYFVYSDNVHDDRIIFFSKDELEKRLRNLNESFQDIFIPPSDEQMRDQILSGHYNQHFTSSYKTPMGRFKKSKSYKRMANEMNSNLDDMYLMSSDNDKWNKILQLLHNFEFRPDQASIIGTASDGTYFTFPDQKVTHFYRFRSIMGQLLGDKNNLRDMSNYKEKPIHIYFDNKYNNELIDAESR